MKDMKKFVKALGYIVLLSVVTLYLSSCGVSGKEKAGSDSAVSKYKLESGDGTYISERIIQALQNSGNIMLYTDSKTLSDYESKFLDYYESAFGGHIEYVYVDKNEMVNTFITDCAGGRPPDAIDLNADNWPIAGNRSLVYSVSELERLGVLGLKHSLVRHYEDICKANFSIGQNCYSVSVKRCDPVVIAVNIDLFSACNVESPANLYSSGKWNFDSFYNSCQRLSVRKDKGTIYGYYGFDPNYFLIAGDCEIVRWDGQQRLMADMFDSNLLSTLRAVRDLYVSKFATDNKTAFADGKCGMRAMKVSELIDECNSWKFYWDITPFPLSINNTSGYVPAEVEGIGVVRSTSNPQGAANYAIARGAFGEVYYDGSSKIKTDEISSNFDKQQGDIIASSKNGAKYYLHSGIGTLYAEQWSFWKDIKSNSDSVTDVAGKYDPIFNSQCKAEMTMRQQ